MRADDRQASQLTGSAHLAAIFDSSHGAIISKTLDGTVLSWNEGAERMFGYTADEMIGTSIRRIIPRDLQGEEDEILTRIGEGEMVGTFETVRTHKDGHAVPVALTVSPILAPDGAIVGASKIAHDLTGEVKHRNAMRFDEERFRMLADNIDQLAWITDASGFIEWYNQRWYDYTGTDLEAMRGWGWETVHHPDHIERVKTLWTRALAEGEGWEDVFPLRGADGEFRWFLSRAHPVRDSRGAVRYWFGTNTDITGQREHQDHIKLLLGEANHRAKNMLTMIQAMVHRIGQGHPDIVDQIERRIVALGNNYEVLIRSEWRSARIRDLIQSQLCYVDDSSADRIQLTGPDLELSSNAAECVGLAIHELVTNAAKYGALADDSGVVDINWKVHGETGRDDRLEIEWVERDGPAVVAPDRKGFGTNLITRNVELSLGAHVTLDYRDTGVRWAALIPLDRALKRSDRESAAD